MQCRERVRGFTRLTHGDDNRAILDDRIAIAEFAREIMLGMHLREVFEEVLPDHACVKRSALTDENHALRIR